MNKIPKEERRQHFEHDYVDLDDPYNLVYQVALYVGGRTPINCGYFIKQK